MSNYKAILTAGFAMFAMFFGSGNLVFPIMIGAKTADQYQYASLGLMITGVLVPFLGLFSMILYHGKKDQLFGLLGKYAPFILSFLILSLIGPFGVAPRCLLVSYGSINLLYPQISLPVFAFIFVALIFFIVYQPNRIVPIIGKILGPLKITGISLIILIAYFKSPPLSSIPQSENPFMLGLTEGYQTMDLMAAFFFSMTIVEYLRSVNKEETLKLSLLSSAVGAFLIAIIYVGFVYLGAHYSNELKNVAAEQYIVTIANLTLGKHATLIVAITIAFSCLVTASSLVKLYAEFLANDITNKQIPWPVSVFMTLVITFTLSLTGFSTIMGFLGAILIYAYPALIALALCAIINFFYSYKFIKETFWLTLIISAIVKNI